MKSAEVGSRGDSADPSLPCALDAVSALLDTVSLAASDADADAVAGRGLWSLRGGEVTEALRTGLMLRSRLDALVLALLHEADLRGLCHDDGVDTTAAWLALLARVERHEARSMLEQATALATGLAAATGRSGVETGAGDGGAVDAGAVGDGREPEPIGDGPANPATLVQVAEREGVALGAELAAGRVSRAQAAAVARAVRALPHDSTLAERCSAEAMLAGYARTLTARQLVRAGARIGELLAAARPDTDDPRESEAEQAAAARDAEDRALAAYQRRDAWWHTRRDGMVEGGFCLDPVTAAPVIAFLDAAARLPDTNDSAEPGHIAEGGQEQDALQAREDPPRLQTPIENGVGHTAVTEVRARPGMNESGSPPTDRRTRRQRAADALSALCFHGLANSIGGFRLPTAATRYPQVTVTVDLDRLRRGLATAGTLDLLTGSRGDEHGALTAGQLRALACDAALIPAVLDGASLPLDLGRTRRVASTAQRAALALRDRGCVMPGCDAPPPGCTAHHITHWGQDGPTDLGNLALLCPAHHTQVHLQHWSLRVTVSGLVELTPPAWVDPDRLPRHHERHIGRNIALRA